VKNAGIFWSKAWLLICSCFGYGRWFSPQWRYLHHLHTIQHVCQGRQPQSTAFWTCICVTVTPKMTLHRRYNTHNRFMALWILLGTTRVSRHQKKHSPTHTHRGHRRYKGWTKNLLLATISQTEMPLTILLPTTLLNNDIHKFFTIRDSALLNR